MAVGAGGGDATGIGVPGLTAAAPTGHDCNATMGDEAGTSPFDEPVGVGTLTCRFVADGSGLLQGTVDKGADPVVDSNVRVAMMRNAVLGASYRLDSSLMERVGIGCGIAEVGTAGNTS
ncbi:MAG: hypothetical protein NVS2B16_13690 [Chloroflexota bacterium]